MRVEIIQHQMNGARRGVTPRYPIKCSRKFSRGTVGRGVGRMATGFGLDHAEHVGSAAPLVLIVAARAVAGGQRRSRSQRVQQLHRPLVQRDDWRMFIQRPVQHSPTPLPSGSKVLLVELRHAPHFLPPWLQRMAYKTDGGWSPAPPCRPRRAAGLPPSSAPRSGARDRVAGSHHLRNDRSPLGAIQQLGRLGQRGHQSAPRPNPAPDTARRRALLAAPRGPSHSAAIRKVLSPPLSPLHVLCLIRDFDPLQITS
jgi:hypothetical protein